jgi:hypothetical protein
MEDLRMTIENRRSALSSQLSAREIDQLHWVSTNNLQARAVGSTAGGWF